MSGRIFPGIISEHLTQPLLNGPRPDPERVTVDGAHGLEVPRRAQEKTFLHRPEIFRSDDFFTRHDASAWRDRFQKSFASNPFKNAGRQWRRHQFAGPDENYIGNRRLRNLSPEIKNENIVGPAGGPLGGREYC